MNIIITRLTIIFLLFFVLSCAKSASFSYEYDYLVTQSKLGHPKGTILLIHGQAPTNIDGRIPAEGKSKYIKIYMFRNLADKLNELGWDVVRYGKYGVYADHVDYDKYKKTDLAFTVSQIQDVWNKMPKGKPVIVFAVSEGTLHVHFLPLKKTDAVILLGAISKNIRDTFLDAAKTPEERRQIKERLDSAFNMKRDKMLGKSAPAGRYVDEINMKDNWTYYKKYKTVPFLILHGESDEEVKLYQSKIWKEKLPDHDITVITKPNGNHIYGTGDSFDAKELATTMDKWLTEKFSTHRQF
jgi:hypothetical protein